MDHYPIVQYPDTGGGDASPTPIIKRGGASPPRLSLQVLQGGINAESSSPEERFLSPRSKLIQHSEIEFKKLKARQKYSDYYHFEKLLGQGAFCQVYQAVDQETQETIAVKVSRA